MQTKLLRPSEDPAAIEEAGALLRAGERGRDFGYLSPDPCARAAPIRLEGQASRTYGLVLYAV